MKKGITLLFVLLMLMLLSVPAIATETNDGSNSETNASGETESTACSHSWGTPVSIDDSQHSVTCTLCSATETVSHNWNKETVITAATCTTDGEKELTCACGNKKRVKISAAGHSYGAWEKLDSAKHERICSTCDEKESGVHTWEEKVTKEATCKEGGSKEKTCKECNTIEVIVISKLTDHTYDNVCDPDCNVCGEKRSTKHSYGSSWSRDYSGHWHECTKCGEKTDFRAHYPGPAATEDAPQLCLTCDYEITPQKEHQHDYAKKWTQDDSGHWYTCTSCSVKKDYATHVYDSACDPYCNVCDYENSSAHDYGNIWETDANKHWQICGICNHKSASEPHVPGPEATETRAQLCTVCGYELAAAQEHVHSFGPEWMYDGKSHWQACVCGEQTVPASHEWDSGTKNKDRTITYRCVLCHAENTEEVSGFPWWVLILFLLLAAGGGAAVYFYYVLPQKQEGKFSAK